jgi:hypothetical protein
MELAAGVGLPPPTGLPNVTGEEPPAFIDQVTIKAKDIYRQVERKRCAKLDTPLSLQGKAFAFVVKCSPAVVGNCLGTIGYEFLKNKTVGDFEIVLGSDKSYIEDKSVSVKGVVLLIVAGMCFMATMFLFLDRRYSSGIKHFYNDTEVGIAEEKELLMQLKPLKESGTEIDLSSVLGEKIRYYCNRNGIIIE